MTSKTLSIFIILLISIFFNLSCSQDENFDKKTNGNLINAMNDLTQILLLGEQTGPQLVIAPELSARVLGVSFDGRDSQNLLWVDKSVYDGTYFKTRPYSWNAGGYRTWVAPESLFFLDSEGEWLIPSQLDPTLYRISEQNEFGITFEADINLKTNIDAYYQLTVRRRISLISEPPADIRLLADGLDYVGIDIIHSVTNRAEETIGVEMPYIGLHNILQIMPAGTVMVPVVAGTETTDAYHESIESQGPEPVLQNNIISFRIDGDTQSKIGFLPGLPGKGIAYLRNGSSINSVLYVMLFSVDREGVYVDNLINNDVETGDVIELYNSDSETGSYGELGCYGPAKVLTRGETQSHSVTLHIFKGASDQLLEIGSLLLGSNLKSAYQFGIH